MDSGEVDPGGRNRGDETSADHARCTVCILPRGARGLGFDGEGRCDACGAHARTVPSPAAPAAGRDPEAFARSLAAAGRGRPYDCLVGLSGGRDSSYLLYLLAERLGLRCVGAFYRTPFAAPEIEANAFGVAAALGVPLERIDLDPRRHAAFARDLLLAWMRYRREALVNLLCVPCKYLHREVFLLARRTGAPAVVFGGNSYESFRFGAASVRMKGDERISSDSVQNRVTLRILARGAGVLAAAPGIVRHLPYMAVGSVCYLNPHTPYLRARFPDVARYDYFYHFPYVEEECDRIALGRLGWRRPPGCTSNWRADCSLADIKNLLFRESVGATYFETYMSNMIRAGAITRERALERAYTEGRPSRPRIRAALEVMRLPPDLLDGIVDREERRLETETGKAPDTGRPGPESPSSPRRFRGDRPPGEPITEPPAHPGQDTPRKSVARLP